MFIRVKKYKAALVNAKSCAVNVILTLFLTYKKTCLNIYFTNIRAALILV